MRKIFILITFLLVFIPSCSENPAEGTRTGAHCKDGTTSSATGSGACSHHGGVDHWHY